MEVEMRNCELILIGRWSSRMPEEIELYWGRVVEEMMVEHEHGMLRERAYTSGKVF